MTGRLELPDPVLPGETALVPPIAEAPVQAWAEGLQQEVRALEDLNRDTEREFVKAGKKLAEFIDKANLLSSELNGLGSMISGEQGQRAADALESALRLSTEMRTRADNSSSALGQIRRGAGQVRQTLASFRGTVATFHSLGLLTRIETARVGNAGADFGNLAEEVRLLARNVQTRVESALDTAGELIPQIENALRDAAALQEGQMRSLPGVVAQVMDSLAAFRGMQVQAADASVRLGRDYKQILKAFENLIVSMQFNDITRQQVEHVISALQRLCARREDGSIYLGCAQAAPVLELQSSQLANTRQTFDSSVGTVLESLDEVGVNVQAMVEETRVLTGLSGGEKNSFFGQMEYGCATILASLSACASADDAAGATSQELCSKMTRMRQAIEEIREIETQMKRIAMNARISAMHLGSSGEALSALADAIRQRAIESRQGSDSLVETLDAMREVAQRSTDEAKLTAQERRSRDACLENLEKEVEALRSSQVVGSQQIDKIFGQAEALFQDVSATRRTFLVSHRFDETVNRTRAKLRQVIEDIRSFFPLEVDGPNSLDLAEFSGTYTMKWERDVHLNAAKGGCTTPGGKLPNPVEEDVEFF